jgi:hypothetical protein
METLLPVAERMNERKLAPVMAEMNPGEGQGDYPRAEQAPAGHVRQPVRWGGLILRGSVAHGRPL